MDVASDIASGIPDDYHILENIFLQQDDFVLLSEGARFGVKSFDGTVFDEITGDVKRYQYPVAQGALADIYTGTWIRPDHKDVEVGIKMLRQVGMEEQYHPERAKEALLRANKRLNREVKVWQMVSHPHTVPLLGFKAGKDPCLITPWYKNGNSRAWLSRNPGECRTRILKETAEALQYLHSFTVEAIPGESPEHTHPAKMGIVHADLKANNILITDDGHAVLGDFGVAKVCLDLGIADATASWGYGCFGFIAPECHNADDGALEPPRDVYAFGGLIIELYSGVPPFWHLRRFERDIVLAISVENTTSPREYHPNVPDWAWDLALRCWTADPKLRPPMSEVLNVLKERLALGSEKP